MSSESTLHVASTMPLAQRTDYLKVLAALTAVDGEVAGAELGVLDEFCKALQVDGPARDEVIASARRDDPAAVRAICERMSDSDLRFTLVTDLLYIAHTDDDYSSGEREVIEGIATLMGIHGAQVDAMERYARSVLRTRTSELKTLGGGDDETHDGAANAAGGLAAAGVPLAAVGLAGGGLSGASIATGLATMGAAVGAGTVGAGLAAAAGLGAVSFFGVRWLYGAIKGD